MMIMNKPLATTRTEEKAWVRLLPPLYALLYPFFLAGFHALQGPGEFHAPGLAAIALTAAFLTSGLALMWASCMQEAGEQTSFQLRTRRAAYLAVVAPTAYVFLGVVLYILHWPFSDIWVWAAMWLALAAWAGSGSGTVIVQAPTPVPGRLRVLHGIAAAVLVLYALFHIANHLFGLVSPEAHAEVMKLGRKVYRAPFVEPVLVALMLFQIASGLKLAWRWTALRADAWRTFQIASGLYLSLFILGHMNSVFVYARTVMKIDTGWDFATGAPTGLIHDAWNIRLVPHYALGVFFVLAHLASGLRIVLMAHGMSRVVADRLVTAAIGFSALISAAILCGMSGVRI